MTGIEYLDLYREMLIHQRAHGGVFPSLGGRDQPWDHCRECLREAPHIDGTEGHQMDEVKRRFAWAVPNPEALDVIARYSPDAVVEIGAGGGYWAMLLHQRGVDVVAYDPVPPPGESGWHTGKAWTSVLTGDHNVVTLHPTRTLLLCWPSYSEPWAADALELYTGDIVIYIGESAGGCTADDRFHVLLGVEPRCYHGSTDMSCPADCVSHVTPLFKQVERVGIPQWLGIHDELGVYQRI